MEYKIGALIVIIGWVVIWWWIQKSEPKRQWVAYLDFRNQVVEMEQLWRKIRQRELNDDDYYKRANVTFFSFFASQGLVFRDFEQIHDGYQKSIQTSLMWMPDLQFEKLMRRWFILNGYPELGQKSYTDYLNQFSSKPKQKDIGEWHLTEAPLTANQSTHAWEKRNSSKSELIEEKLNVLLPFLELVRPK